MKTKKERKIKVSIIVYVKNGENHIEQCIRSLMNQTLKAIEIIVIDGDSTDNTLNILELLMKEDDRIKLFKGPSSVGAQFNLGLSIACGNYVGICEADDFVDRDMYRKLYRYAKLFRCEVAKADFCKVYKVGDKVEKVYQSTARDEDKNKPIRVRANVGITSGGIWKIWSGIYSREFLVKNNIKMNETPGASYQDNTFSFLCEVYVKRFCTLSKPLYFYRIDNPEASVNSKNCIVKHKREYECLEKELKLRGLWGLYKEAFFYWEMSSYIYFYYGLGTNERKEAFDLIYDFLVKQILSENIATEGNGGVFGDAIYYFSKGADDFREFLEVRAMEVEKMINYFLNIDSSKSVVLFGLGHFGSIIYHYLEKLGVKMILMDNDEQKQRRGFEGHKVCVPGKIDSDDVIYVVANIRYARQMADQLILEGVTTDKILICQDENRFVRRVLAYAD